MTIMVAHTMQLPVRGRLSLKRQTMTGIKTARRETGVPAGAAGTPIVSCGQTDPHAAGNMSASLVGFMRVRRHSHHHA